MFRFLALVFVVTVLPVIHAEDSFLWVRVAISRNIPTLTDVHTMICKRDYHGTIRVIKNKQGSYDAVNILDIEDFLLGVVSREMNPSAPLEALKAQAIAARSYALYQTLVSESQPYDLVANLSEAYIGKTKLHKNVLLAIETTRGQVLSYHGKTIPAYFHASCGGHTETVVSVWHLYRGSRGNALSKWSTAARCADCSSSSENKWSYEILVKTLQRIMKQSGYSIGASPFIKITEKGPGEHAISMTIQSETGELRLSAEKFRAILGYSNLRSTLFDVHRTLQADGTPGDRFVFQGGGHGHGVGLCQFGAQEIAERGASYHTILTHYFPNCKIRSYPLTILTSLRFNEKLGLRN